jgi:predicted metal-dependent HD superfamily phosphohydrolase
MNEKPIVQKAAAYVAGLFKRELPNTYVYHNLPHTSETVEASREAAEYYQLNEEEQTILLLAAWFHDTGYVKVYIGHEDESRQYARFFLEKEQFPEEKIKQVEALIASTRAEHKPGNLCEEILHDADHINIGKKRFFRKAELLRIEWEFFLNKYYTDREWAREQENFIIGTNFYTEYFRRAYGPRREKNIEKQRSSLVKEKLKRKKARAPKRGTETMYRATYRNHINLSSIADQKANMMISINTIIMSIIITVVGSGFTITGQSFVESIRYTIPICILLLGSLFSVIYAILSARPHVTKKKVDLEKIQKKESSTLFFGNFSNMKLQEFIDNMQELMKSRELLYDNMTIDLYYLGLVLTEKYKLLRISYNVFMSGIILAVVAFISIFLYSQYMH